MDWYTDTVSSERTEQPLQDGTSADGASLGVTVCILTRWRSA